MVDYTIGNLPVDIVDYTICWLHYR
jgi:hypothetical protein